MKLDHLESCRFGFNPPGKSQRDLDFQVWMADVQKSLDRRTGGVVDIDDLSDWSYRDAYDSGRRPEAVAGNVLKDNGWR